jgi:hypothetical protein
VRHHALAAVESLDATGDVLGVDDEAVDRRGGAQVPPAHTLEHDARERRLGTRDLVVHEVLLALVPGVADG